MHSGAVGGHSGVNATYNRMNFTFEPGMRTMVTDIVGTCEICQLNKHENVATPGLLVPLPAPEGAWQHIAMDFIEKLHKSKGLTLYRL